MNWDALGAIAEIVGALAVVLSLVYLATQIRQSNSLANAQSRREMLQFGRDELYQMVQNPGIWLSFEKSELTDEEKVRLSALLVTSMRNREFEWLQWKDGNIDDQTFESYRVIAPIVLGTERTKSWWARNKKYFDPEFAAHIDSSIKDAPLTDFWSSTNEWK